MKPIELKLAGLQSYREEQCLDFRTLCETGLFGIFGPTGSGKSTILDAMTLALYGKVERATNGTQGILNQAENQLSVAFTFELNGAGERRAFRVERRFKRTGDITVSNSVSRFVEITPEGEVVLADKLAEVTRCVEQHIGLKMDDFTRAVVLPQGKFAEFLSLKGSDRRQMLQRLFSLEKYGDELSARISRRAKDAEAELMAYSAEQQGLGDASQEALASAEQALTEAAEQAELAKASKQAAEQEYHAMAEQRELQQEHARISRRMSELQNEAPKRAEEETKLNRAREAERIAPIALEAEQLIVKRNMAVAEHASREEQAGIAASDAQKAVTAAEEAKHVQEREEPELLRRSEQLQEAVRLQQECERLRKEEGEWKLRLESAHARYDSAASDIERSEQLLKKAAARQEELRTTLAAHVKTAEEQEHFHQAISYYDKITFMEGRSNELNNHRMKHEAQTEAVNRKLNDKLEELLSAAGTIRHKLEEGLHSRTCWRRLREQVSHLFVQVESAMDDERQKQWKETAEQMAVQLALSLVNNESCPVCGSKEHPAPAHVHASAKVNSTNGDERWRQWEQLKNISSRLLLDVDAEAARSREQFSTWMQRLQEVSERASQLIRDQLSAVAEEDQLRGEHPSWRDSLTELAAAQSFGLDNKDMLLEGESPLQAGEGAASEQAGSHTYKDVEELDLAAVENQLTALQQDVQSFIQNARTMEGLMEQLLKDAAGKQWELQQLSSSYQSSYVALRDANRAWKEAEEALAKQHEEWNLRYKAFQWEFAQMPSLQQEWTAREAVVSDCRERLEKSAVYIEEMKERILQYTKERQAAEVERVNAQAECNGVARLLGDYETRLKPWLQKQSIEEFAAATSARLAELRERVKRTADEAERLRAASEAAGRQAALAAQVLTSLAEQVEVSGQRLQDLLSKSSFTEISDVHAARMTEELTSQLEQTLLAYHDAVRDVSSQLNRLQERIGSSVVTDEQWNACSEKKVAAEAAAEEALARKAKAERDAEQLRSKHARWTELEEARSRTEEYAGRLHQLQAVFRGNAFVEFIAEEQLMQVSRAASERLKVLTKQRYALEVDSGGGFVIRDDGNGGIRRPVSTLSGGETFLTSLALALALSSQIQLRGKYPLEFFFLDEGFGTLDPELLDTVVTALEKLHSDRLSVGVISHVPELRARLARKLAVIPAEQAGEGSRIVMETN
ncbi:AAA family ATPase [Paenibacillus sp. NAIST15-1]|uniref:AAA family ATPase n=1 Tax=Paenibacillus sp. NAIST15-1 TaxID=1605994 RepID=UPI00086DA58E|nr:AAA family ATPase [Paenibacillus sp. NAIST15-1]GAV12287.1 SMC domain-containing protein [Paenibacillus sp. NAIST15-1]